MTENRTLVLIPCIFFISICFGQALQPDEHSGMGSGEIENAADLGEFGSVGKVGDLVHGRYNHTSTLLNDGRVFVAGGTGNGRNALRSAELYDPENGAWEGTTNMTTGRMRHTGTLLDSGMVLVVGGFLGNGHGHPSSIKHFNGTGNISLGSCEVFDPVNGSFSPSADLNTGRFWHRSVKLNDGRVLVVGGLNVSRGVLSSCEVFDPMNGKWTKAASLGRARVRFTATRMVNGSVLVTGGHNGMNKEPFTSCELYVPEKDRWFEVSPMNKPRGYHAGVLLKDGRVLVSGGFAGMGIPDWSDSEVYDPTNDSWELSGEMSLPRHNHVLALTVKGEVLVIGGSNYLTGGGHSGIEYFDPGTGSWNHTNLVITGLKWTTATELNDGTILVCGGKEYDDASNVSYVFTPPPDLGKDAEDDDMTMQGFGGAMMVMAFTAIAGIRVRGSSRKTEGEKE